MANAQDIAGKELNGYKVIKPIGQGKFSIVFKGEKISDGQIVALKQIKVGLAAEG
jgi:serine/threonine protein kinase